MVAAHVLDRPWLVEGRASALFAVLAGVSLALMAPRTNAAGLATRAVLVALLGLALGELDSGLAIILANYGLLFLLAIPFVRLPTRVLLALAAVWVVAAPVVSQLLRPHLPARQYASPDLGQLAHPLHLLSELAVTGYYPCLPWLTYLLLGLAVGRLDLRSRETHAILVAAGLGVALLAFAVSRAFTQQPWVLSRLLPDAGGYGDVATGGELVHAIGAGMHGTTPTGGSWAWLLVVAPHSGTPFDLLETGACAVLAIGLCLAALSLAGRRTTRAVAVVFGAGTMTLTLYSLHAVMRTPAVWPAEQPSSFGWHVLVLLGVGAACVALQRRGPLETMVGLAQRRVAGIRSERRPCATRSPGRCP